MGDIREGLASSYVLFQSWPTPDSSFQYSVDLDDGGRLELWSLSTARLAVYLSDPDGNRVWRFISQQICITTSGPNSFPYFHFQIKWKSAKYPVVKINGTELQPQSDSESMFNIDIDEDVRSGSVSFNDSTASQVCESAVKIRKRWYSKHAAIMKRKREEKELHGQPSGRREKIISEQLADLIDCVKRLRILISLVKSGKSIWLGVLATEIRALTTVTNPGGNYDPLLFRLAKQGGLALPIYCTKQISIGHSGDDEVEHKYAVAAPPSMISYANVNYLMDFQEWLRRDFIYVRGVGVRNAQWLICECASAFGPAHYDEAQPIFIDYLVRTGGNQATTLESSLVGIAECVFILSCYVIDNLDTISEDELSTS